MLSYTALLHPTTQKRLHAAMCCLVVGKLKNRASLDVANGIIHVFKRPQCGSFEFIHSCTQGEHNITQHVYKALRMQLNVPAFNASISAMASMFHVEQEKQTPTIEHITLQPRAVFEPIAEYRPIYWGKESACTYEWEQVEYRR